MVQWVAQKPPVQTSANSNPATTSHVLPMLFRVMTREHIGWATEYQSPAENNLSIKGFHAIIACMSRHLK